MASIEKRTTSKGQARWEVRYRVAGREISRSFKTRGEAIAHRRTVEHDEMHGTAFDPRGAKITLHDWWARWWPSTVNLRDSSRARDESYYSARIKPTLGESELAKIDRATLRAWVGALQADGLAPATVTKAAQILSKTLRAAVDDGRLGRNPAERLDLPRVEREETRFLTPAQVDDLAATIDERYRALVIVGAYGGLRLGEMLALSRSRVDLLHRHLDVVETVATVRGRLVMNPPKTRAGHRRVPLPRLVVEALEHHYGAVRGDLVFPAPDGGYVRAELWRRRVWQPACVSAGLGKLVETDSGKRYEGLRPHDLRHTAVAFWIAAGASPKEIAARAGHSSVVTVLDRYGHLLPGSADAVNDALDAIARLARDARGMDGQVIRLAGTDGSSDLR
jgi:integrase